VKVEEAPTATSSSLQVANPNEAEEDGYQSLHGSEGTESYLNPESPSGTDREADEVSDDESDMEPTQDLRRRMRQLLATGQTSSSSVQLSQGQLSQGSSGGSQREATTLLFQSMYPPRSSGSQESVPEAMAAEEQELEDLMTSGAVELSIAQKMAEDRVARGEPDLMTVEQYREMQSPSAASAASTTIVLPGSASDTPMSEHTSPKTKKRKHRRKERQKSRSK